MKITSEQGAIMVESTWCILLVLFVCLFFISYGLMLYQHTMVTIVANDIAEDIALTYKFKNVPNASSVNISDAYSVGKYRYLLFSDEFDSANDSKATAMARTRLGYGAMAKSAGYTNVNVEKYKDDIGRFHLTVTVKQPYRFLFGDLLSVIGQQDVQMIEASVNVMGTDMVHYSNTLHTISCVMDLVTENEAVKLIDNAISLLGTLFNIGC